MTTSPTWTPDAADDAYTLIADDIRCRVWRTTFGDWGAMISRRGIGTASYSFATVDEAKAWCEQQIAKVDRRM